MRNIIIFFFGLYHAIVVFCLMRIGHWKDLTVYHLQDFCSDGAYITEYHCKFDSYQAAVIFDCHGKQSIRMCRSRKLSVVDKSHVLKFACVNRILSLLSVHSNAFNSKLICFSGERKFKCDWQDCGKAFKHSDNLKVNGSEWV